jgi:hypothetical protein
MDKFHRTIALVLTISHMRFVIDSVTGGIDISLSGSLIPPSASAGGAEGCLVYDPLTLLSETNTPLVPDPPRAALRTAMQTTKPEVCIDAKGKAGTSFEISSCSVEIKFSTRTGVCTCAPCGAGNTGVLINCSSVDFTKLILGPTATPPYNLPAFPCIGG